MMNGILLDEGYPIINVPVRKKRKFNILMLVKLELYSSNDMKSMNIFLRNCLHGRIIANFKIANS